MVSSKQPRFFRQTLLAVSLLAAWQGLPGGELSAAPQISNVSPRGLQIGASTLLTIDGADLIPEPRVLLPLSLAGQTLKDGATANRIQIEVTLPANVRPGMYSLRIGNARGVSNAVLIGIDDLPQVPFSAQIAGLPVALHGNLTESETLLTSFNGKKGQRILVDLEARRLGAAIDPVLHLYDPRRVQVAWSQGRSALDGDARLEAILPADGAYSLELHDALYRAGSPNHFRLKIGDLLTADLVFPLGGRRGTEPWFELVGSGFSPPLRVRADLREAVGDASVPLPALRGLTGPAPRIVVGDFPEVLEADMPMGKLQEVAVPAVINGRIGKPHEEDRYRLLVKPGMKLRFDVLASRAGSPLDAVLSLQNDAGAELAAGNERPELKTIDPGLDFTVPDGVQALVVVLKDLEGRGGPTFLYRLSITPSDRPNFRLTLFEDRHNVPQGGAAVMRVRAERAGYNGPIKLTLPDVPANVTVAGNEIPAGATDALVTLNASPSGSRTQWLTKIVGASADPKAGLIRTALLPKNDTTERQPWLRSELAFGVIEAAPIRIAWEKASLQFAIGTNYPMKLVLTRAAGANGSVRLTLLTSQIVPRTQDGKQEDRNRALRFEGTPQIGAGQSAVEARIIIPADLPSQPYDVAVRAELLGPDGQSVLASVVSPAHRLVAAQPFALQLAGPATVQAASGSGPTGKLKGKIVRVPGFDKPVTITLTGLPPELAAPSIMLTAGQSDFELPVAFPFETKLGPLPNAKLVATSQVSPQKQFTSNELPIAVQVVQGSPPPPPPALLRLFEDEPSFAALLHEGDGQASLEPVDRYSGSLALQVNGVQRFRAKMPGWGYKIAEKPGTGEFRYLRFAWKKHGGGNILLQLNANGKWGPQRGSPGPSYRYEAGPAENPLKLAALKVDSHLPQDWVVVTRDLFKDFGPFALTGISFVAGSGESALFDHLYLARSMEDFKGCPGPVPPSQPFAIFEDQPEFVADLLEGAGTARLEDKDKYSGKASVKVTPDQRFNERLSNLGMRIRQNPGPGEHRFLRFAWKKNGGQTICLQLNHDGNWGPSEGAPGKFRYHAGPGPECFGASINLDTKIPTDWVVVTRDLYADFGEFTLTGIALSPIDGEYALFDHIYLGRTTRDFELVKPKLAGAAK
jgi:hypothetical protein